MTLSKRVIARLDIKGSKLIKGISFEGVRVIGDACSIATEYGEQRIDEIFYSDAVASLYGRNGLADLLKETCKNIFVPITAGGAINSVEDGQNLLSAGADKLAINTGVVRDPTLINRLANSFGRQCVVISIQARKSIKNNNWDVMIESGRDRSKKNLINWLIEVQERGAGEIFLTSVDNDGTAKGPDLELIKMVSPHIDIPLVVGGGITKETDIQNIFTINKKISGIAIGWSFHKSKIKIKEVKSVIKKNNLFVRGTNIVEKNTINTTKHVAVIDYSMGNVQSLCNALDKIGAKVTLTSKPDLVEADYWALPGVGAFPEGMKRLKEYNLIEKLKERSKKGLGIIGICLGMQLLFEESNEHVLTKGLGLIDGSAKKLPSKNNILPHVGWNKLKRTSVEKNFLKNIDSSFYQYFVHSFAVQSNDYSANSAIYEFDFGGNNFVAAAKKNKIIGLQFHPERSGLMGLKLLSEILNNNV